MSETKLKLAYASLLVAIVFMPAAIVAFVIGMQALMQGRAKDGVILLALTAVVVVVSAAVLFVVGY